MDEYLVLQFPIVSTPPITEEHSLKELMKGLTTLVEIGAIKGPLDEVLIDYEIDLDNRVMKAYLVSDALLDGSKLNTVGSSLVIEVPKELLAPVLAEELEIEDKTFSVATIQERLRLSNMNPKIRMRYIVMDYKRFWNSRKSSMEKNPDNAIKLKNMFLTDLTGIFNEIVPFIEEGKQLNTLLGLSQITPRMNKVARDLSLTYRRALKAEKTSGQLSKGIYQKLKLQFGEFMSTLVVEIFPGIEDILASNQSEENKNLSTAPVSKTYSYLEDGRIDIFNQ